jgi:excisionase family DNA binding protein
MNKEIMTVPEVAEYTRMSALSVRRLLKRKILPGVKLGRHWRLRRVDVDRLLDPNKEDAEPDTEPAVAKGHARWRICW